MGINRTSEGIASLWGNPRSPLVAAGTRAMRTTVRELEQEFKPVRPLPTPSPFQLLLLRDSVNDLAPADLSQPYANANAVQQALDQHLDQLLYGHDEHAVALLRQHLLDRFAPALHRFVGRAATAAAVQEFVTPRVHPDCPVVLTCRVRAFTDDLRASLGWAVETLAPFPLGQVRHFVPAWYRELAAVTGMDAA